MVIQVACIFQHSVCRAQDRCDQFFCSCFTIRSGHADKRNGFFQTNVTSYLLKGLERILYRDNCFAFYWFCRWKCNDSTASCQQCLLKKSMSVESCSFQCNE